MLYHGSKNFIQDQLEPRVSYELKKWVYATDNWLYALIRCGAFDITKFLIREEHGMYTHQLAEVFPGAFDEVFNRPGYIYEVDDSTFEFTHGYEYVSEKPVMIKGIQYIENVLDELKKHPEIELVSYDDTEEYWKQVRGGREGYLKRKQEYLPTILKARS